MSTEHSSDNPAVSHDGSPREEQQRKSQRSKEKRTALIVVGIMALVTALIIAGVFVAKWADQTPRVLRDERIAGHEVKELSIGGHDRETTLIRLKNGTSAADALGLLKALKEHNRTVDSDDYIRRPYMLATEDGRPLWDIDDGFLVAGGTADQISAALWLADQEPTMTWSFSKLTSSAPGEGSLISIDVDEEYEDLRFLNDVMSQFPTHRVFLDYPDAPAVNLPAGRQDLIPDMEKLIAAWGGEPLTYGAIDRFFVPDVGIDGAPLDDANGQQPGRIELNIWLSVAEADPAYFDAGGFYANGKPRDEFREQEKQELEEQQRQRWQEIRDLLIEEARTLIPNADVTFFN